MEQAFTIIAQRDIKIILWIHLTIIIAYQFVKSHMGNQAKLIPEVT